MNELRNIERELFRFRRRLILAAGVVVLSFALLIGRWAWETEQHAELAR